MAGPRQPIELIIAKGQKHLTKAEIEQRRASEPTPCTDEIAAPTYLTAAQKKHFVKLARQLEKIRIMGETDVDTLSRYVVAEFRFRDVVKELRQIEKEKPKEEDFDTRAEYYTARNSWLVARETIDKRMERYLKQASAVARDLGLTISSRCRLQVPIKEEAPKENKFAQFVQFGKVAGDE